MKIQIKRGNQKNLPKLDIAEPAFTTDAKKAYIGSSEGNIELLTEKHLKMLQEDFVNGSGGLMEKGGALEKILKGMMQHTESTGAAKRKQMLLLVNKEIDNLAKDVFKEVSKLLKHKAEKVDLEKLSKKVKPRKMKLTLMELDRMMATLYGDLAPLNHRHKLSHITEMDVPLDLQGQPIKNVNHIEYVVDPTNVPDQEGVSWWNPDEHTMNLNTGLGPVLQVGQELYTLVYNNTASTIDNGTAVYPVGAVAGFPSVEEASSDTHVTIAGIILITTMDIPAGSTGIVATIIGKVRGVDTSMFSSGETLWVAPTGAGVLNNLTNVKPSFPDYVVQVGGVDVADATEGIIQLAIEGKAIDTTQNFWNGTFRETFTTAVTSNGSVITLALTPTNGNVDMTMIFSDGFSLLDTSPSATVTLTPGTDINPELNYVYVPKSTKTLTAGISGFPTDEHIKVGTYLVQSATTVQTYDALKIHNHNDHLQSAADDIGHLSHIAERLRQEDAKWDTGTEGSATINTNVGTPDNVYLSNTSGFVYQVHKQTFGALDMETGDHAHIVNDFSTPYKLVTDLGLEILDANGDSLTNRHFSFVFWGVNNSGDNPNQIMVNLPIGSYNAADSAAADALNYAVYTIPKDFQGTGFLIARFTFNYSASGGGTWTLTDTQDLRGRFPNVSAGGSGGGGGASTFLGLTDTDSSYTGQAGKMAVVDDGEASLPFSNTLKAPTTTREALVLQTTDDNSTSRLLKIINSSSDELASFDYQGHLGIGTIPGDDYGIDAQLDVTTLAAPIGNKKAGIQGTVNVDLTSSPFTSGAFTGVWGIGATDPNSDTVLVPSLYGGLFRTDILGDANTVRSAAVYAQTQNNAAGTVSNAYGLYVDGAINAGGGTVTDNYGVYIANQRVGTNDYGLYTNEGINRLGDQVKIEGSQDIEQLIVKAHSTQTSDLQEWQNSSGTVLSSISNLGKLTIAVPTATTEALVLQTTDNDSTKNLFEGRNSADNPIISITQDSANQGALQLYGSTGIATGKIGTLFSNDLVFWTTGGGNQMLRMLQVNTWTDGASSAFFQVGTTNSNGLFTSSNGLKFNRFGINSTSTLFSNVANSTSMTPPTAVLEIHNVDTTQVNQIIKAAPSQTANLTEWQDSSGVIGSFVDSDRWLNTPSSAPTTDYMVANKKYVDDNSGGEANTSSNGGTGGVGIVLPKSGVDLPFKSINAGSNKVTVTDDAVNSNVDIDVDESNLTLSNIGGSVTDAQVPNTITLDNLTQVTTRSHTALSDKGTNTHAQIDAHLASTSNPHSVTAAQVAAIPVGGWTAVTDSWTYSSADDPTFVITVPSDATTEYSVGMRIKLTQTTVKYFIITGVTATTLTVYGGTDYDLVNAAISDISYSTNKAPLNFPLDPAKWTVEVTDTNNVSDSTLTLNVWEQFGSLLIGVPVGVWRLYYQVDFQAGGAGNDIVAQFALSTSTSSSSDNNFISETRFRADAQGAGDPASSRATFFRENIVSLATKDTYYLIGRATGSDVSSITLVGANSPTIVRAVCTYL
jgi:hypothetical protein